MLGQLTGGRTSVENNQQSSRNLKFNGSPGALLTVRSRDRHLLPVSQTNVSSVIFNVHSNSETPRHE